MPEKQPKTHLKSRKTAKPSGNRRHLVSYSNVQEELDDDEPPEEWCCIFCSFSATDPRTAACFNASPRPCSCSACIFSRKSLFREAFVEQLVLRTPPSTVAPVGNLNASNFSEPDSPVPTQLADEEEEEEEEEEGEGPFAVT